MTDTAQLIVAAAAVLGAAAYIMRVVWKGFRVVEQVRNLLDHELNPNSGSSLRDRVDKSNRDLADLRSLLAEHLSESALDRERLAAVEAKTGIR